MSTNYYKPGSGIGTGDVTTVEILDGTVVNADVDAAAAIAGSKITTTTTSALGVAEAAVASEVNTGTDIARIVTPDALAGSNIGTKTVQMVVVDFGTATATGDGKFYFHVPASLAGMNIITVHAEVITAGTTNTTDIQLHNLTAAADILSTKLTIDSAETGSDTAATPAVISATEDDLTENDIIRVDVDAVSTTPANGLIVTFECQLP